MYLNTSSLIRTNLERESVLQYLQCVKSAFVFVGLKFAKKDAARCFLTSALA